MLGPQIKVNWKWSNEMTRVNINYLGISELKWTGMGEFNSDDHCIYYSGQESLRRNGEGNGKLRQHSCLEKPMNSMKRHKDSRTLKDELPRSVGAQ